MTIITKKHLQAWKNTLLVKKNALNSMELCFFSYLCIRIKRLWRNWQTRQT